VRYKVLISEKIKTLDQNSKSKQDNEEMIDLTHSTLCKHPEVVWSVIDLCYAGSNQGLEVNVEEINAMFQVGSNASGFQIFAFHQNSGRKRSTNQCQHH
jgi:hypothetical protein